MAMSVALDLDLHNRLKAMAKYKKRSMGALALEAVQQYLEREAAKSEAVFSDDDKARTPPDGD